METEGSPPTLIFLRVFLTGLVIGCGFIIGISVAAAAQLWTYPYPRSLLLSTVNDMTIAALAAATGLGLCYSHNAYTRKSWNDFWNSVYSVLAFILLFFSLSYIFIPSISYMRFFVDCRLGTDRMCEISLDKMTSCEEEKVLGRIWNIEKGKAQFDDDLKQCKK